MALLNTDLVTDIVFFSFDAIVSYALLKGYCKACTYINSIKEARAKTDADIPLENSPGEIKKYVLIKGSVKASKNSIPSRYVSNISGVVQRLSTRELLMKRSSSGFWCNESRLINESYNTVPFVVVVDKCPIEVKDVLLADELHLDTVYDKYDTTVHSLSGNVWSYFFGVRQNGVKTVEEMLKEGTVVTCIGDLLTTSDGSRSLVPPEDGKPFLITTQHISKFLESCKTTKLVTGIVLLFTGSLTIYFGYRLGCRLYTFIKKRKENRALQQRLQESRKLRRQNVRSNTDDLPDSLRCVICQENPREIIMLPCGHLCSCEECSERLSSTCPICRSYVETRAVAFLS